LLHIAIHPSTIGLFQTVINLLSFHCFNACLCKLPEYYFYRQLGQAIDVREPRYGHPWHMSINRTWQKKKNLVNTT